MYKEYTQSILIIADDVRINIWAKTDIQWNELYNFWKTYNWKT